MDFQSFKYICDKTLAHNATVYDKYYCLTMILVLNLLWGFAFWNEPFNVDIDRPVVLMTDVTDQRSRDTFRRNNRTHTRRLHSVHTGVQRAGGRTANGKLWRAIALIVKIEIVQVFRGGHAGRGGADRRCHRTRRVIRGRSWKMLTKYKIFSMKPMVKKISKYQSEYSKTSM